VGDLERERIKRYGLKRTTENMILKG